jgi:hypothetical protein
MIAERPLVRVGDAWQFRAHDRLLRSASEETRRVLLVDKQRIVCEIRSTDSASPSGRAEYTREWNLLSRPAATFAGDEPDSDNRWRWTPRYPQFRFPLETGDSWNGQATVENRATGTRNEHDYRATVLPATRVTVPAGSFDVLPVRFASTVASDDGTSRLAWRNEETLFYAPRVNLFAFYEQTVTGPDGKPARHLTLELLRYQPAR